MQRRVHSLNAPYGARCFLTWASRSPSHPPPTRLNAPYGARCFLTTKVEESAKEDATAGLNAPYGARCFLTGRIRTGGTGATAGLNAPYGARCFLTPDWLEAARRGFQLS